MRGYVLITLLMALLFSAAAFSGEPRRARGRQTGNPEQKMRMRQMQMNLEEREMEMDFHRQSRELELEERRIAIEREHHGQRKDYHKDGKGVFWVICMIVNILLAVWVYGDIRKRGVGSGIWIVIVLLTGLFGVVPYAIVRLGDMRQTE